jgi:hypothetical protein
MRHSRVSDTHSAQKNWGAIKTFCNGKNTHTDFIIWYTKYGARKDIF